MNVRRFTARNSRDALQMVRHALGEDAVVLSTKPCPEGVEVLALGPQSLQQLARNHVAATSQAATVLAAAPARADASVQEDVAQLQMSTLSFQDYVRQRMQRRLSGEQANSVPATSASATTGASPGVPHEEPMAAAASANVLRRRATRPSPVAEPAAAVRPAPQRKEVPVLREEISMAPAAWSGPERLASVPSQADLMSEMRAMKSLIEDRFGALAFMEKLQRHPRPAQLTQRLMDCGFSPQMVRHLVDSLPPDAPDDMAWACGVLERNLLTSESERKANPGDLVGGLEDNPGTYALVGPTGVGKTTSTAKIAAAFAARHGAGQLGLITLDVYRMAAHEQLRSYGRILGVPVHTAHDRASLEDLLELLAGKRMVLIDTAGMAPRDVRTRELLDMLSAPSIRKVLVMNAGAQAETLEDVMPAYRAPQCVGAVLSKLDEAVKLGPALDVLIRHRLRVLGVANGQRVPEDWHRLSANALVHRALRAQPGSAWRMDGGELNLVFAAQTRAPRAEDSARSF